MTTYIRVSATIFSLIAAFQLLRALRAWPLDIAGTSVPVAASIVAAVVTGALAAWGWSFARRGAR
jgi:hypothetical protein